MAFWASQMEGSSNKLEYRLCGSKSILRIHPVSTIISHLIHSSIISQLTFYSLTSSYDTPVSTIISHLILFHYLTFYSLTSHPLLIAYFIHFITYLDFRWLLHVICEIWQIPLRFHQDRGRLLVEKVDKIITRLYFLVIVSTVLHIAVASGPLPATSSIIS